MSKDDYQASMPSSVHPDLGFFDRFADRAAALVSRAPFFAASVLLVVAWLIEGVVRIAVEGSFRAFISDTYQLQINTLTTIITFLLVALLQNTQTRADKATQEKLNAIADALGDLMMKIEPAEDAELERDVEELRAAVGLEEIVGADDAQ
jgi:low affinity Fe/Cu permease